MKKILFLLSVLLIFSACKSRDDRCDQAMYNLMNLGIYDNNTYEMNKPKCVRNKSWDDDYLDCVADAKTKKDLGKCTPKEIKSKFE
ncbi:hypothetical protein JXR93_11800 [bacterium]|nr:hypothetical protein [bacterium]